MLGATFPRDVPSSGPIKRFNKYDSSNRLVALNAGRAVAFEMENDRGRTGGENGLYRCLETYVKENAGKQSGLRRSEPHSLRVAHDFRINLRFGVKVFFASFGSSHLPRASLDADKPAGKNKGLLLIKEKLVQLFPRYT